MTEYELKFLLSKQEYECLWDYLQPNGMDTRQVNYYYDTDDFYLYRKDVTCRIRHANNAFWATIKRHGIPCGGSDERLVRVDGVPELFPLADFPIKYRGSLETKRTTLPYGAGVWIMLDRNSYLEQTDYELEIEYEQNRKESVWEAAAMLAAQLVKQGVCASTEEFFQRVGKGESKSRRFFKRFMELSGIKPKTYD